MPQFLNPENIFPKRLGIMHGNTLVVEYYDLTRDKFKRHPIPYDPTGDIKTILDEIYKNTKHIPYLKKVDPKHLKAVLEGQVIAPTKKPFAQEKEMFQEFAEKPATKQEERYHVQEPAHQQTKRESNFFSNDSQVSSKSKKQSEGKASKPEEIDDYYAEEFEDFEVSQSMQKKNISSFSNIEKPKPTGVSSSSSSSFSKPKESKIQIPSKHVEKEVIEESIEQYADDFEFIDEDPAPKKEKKLKEQKEEKQEKKETKEKKQKKEKKDKSKSKDKKKKEKQKKESPPKDAEEQFQFL